MSDEKYKIDDSMQTVFYRLEFYRKRYKLAQYAVILLFFGIFAAAAFAWHGATWLPSPRYIPIFMNDQPVLHRSLADPIYKEVRDRDGNLIVNYETALFSWAGNRAIDINSYNWVSYRRRIQELRQYFTSNGWDAWLGQLENVGVINFMNNYYVRRSAVFRDEVRLIGKQEVNGTYAWRFWVPLIITEHRYINGEPDEITLYQDVVFTIERVDEAVTPDAIAIRQVVQARCNILSLRFAGETYEGDEVHEDVTCPYEIGDDL